MDVLDFQREPGDLVSDFTYNNSTVGHDQHEKDGIQLQSMYNLYISWMTNRFRFWRRFCLTAANSCYLARCPS